MADVTIAFDPGSLRSKAIFSLKPFKPELLLMNSEVAEVSQKSLEGYEETIRLGSPNPEDAAWIEYKGQYRAVGFLAKDSFYADLKLSEPKFQTALYKTLAIVGSIAQKKCLPNGASVRLGFLLPYGEYEDRKLYEQMITDAIAGFRFRGEERSFELESCLCRPEGFGLLSRGRAPGSNIKEQVIVVIMVGYRDASVYVMNRGSITRGSTKELGFNRFVESVQRQAPNQKVDRLVAAICKAGPKISVKALAHLARFSEPALRDEEIARIREAIASAREQYWLTLSFWLRNHVPAEVDEIIIAGGTAYYYEREFNALFSGTNVNWCTELEEQVNRCFLTKIAEHGLGFRLTDNCGFFYYLCGTAEPAKRMIEHVRTN